MIRDEMMARMSAYEFREWIALAQLDARPKEQTPEEMLQVLREFGP
jgi:hypothetical protein